ARRRLRGDEYQKVRLRPLNDLHREIVPARGGARRQSAEPPHEQPLNDGEGDVHAAKRRGSDEPLGERRAQPGPADYQESKHAQKLRALGGNYSVERSGTAVQSSRFGVPRWWSAGRTGTVRPLLLLETRVSGSEPAASTCRTSL